MMRLPVAALLLCLSIFLPTGVARANDALPPLPKPDAKGQWRVITQDDATTTSKCIGSTATPLCAMETFLAFGVRNGADLYNKSALLFPGEEVGDIGTPSPLGKSWLKYRILSAEVLRKRDIPPPVQVCSKKWQPNCTDFPSAWHPGDVRIKITSQECRDRKCSHEDGLERGRALRKIGEEWKVVLMRRSMNRIDDIDGKPFERPR